MSRDDQTAHFTLTGPLGWAKLYIGKHMMWNEKIKNHSTNAKFVWASFNQTHETLPRTQ